MEPKFIQIIIFLVAVIWCNQKNIGLKYLVIMASPFYAFSLVEINIVSTHLLPMHVLAFALVVSTMARGTKISGPATFQSILILLPFIIALVYNLFFFESIEVWEIQGEDRTGYNPIGRHDSLTYTNITQLIYLLIALCLYVIYSSVDLNKQKLKSVVDATFLIITAIGIFQVVAYYIDVDWIYRLLFYSLGENVEMADQMFLWGMKRINSTFQEPSYMGYYICFALMFYAACFGYASLKQSVPAKLLFLLGIFSTATTFLWGACVLTVVLYLYYSTPNEKMVYYILFALLSPLLIYFGTDVVLDYMDAKQSSTDMRMNVSWDLAWAAFYKSPIFGYGYGTTRPLFIYTQLLVAIGALGSVMFVAAFLYRRLSKQAILFLVFAIVMGIGSFELVRPEMWIFFGLLTNKSLAGQPIVGHKRAVPVSNRY